MIRNLIAVCLSRRPLVLIGFVAFLAIGLGAFSVLNIEAYPDPAPPIIETTARTPKAGIAASRTLRAIGPAWSSEEAKAMMPQREQRP